MIRGAVAVSGERDCRNRAARGADDAAHWNCGSFDGARRGDVADAREAAPRRRTRDVVAQTNPGQRVELTIGEGIYDAQAIREQGDQVVSIRWANRLVVMPYPDEGGHHLEVVNFKSGFGALQVRSRDGVAADVALYPTGSRSKEVASPIAGRTYALFVVPAGKYRRVRQRHPFGVACGDRCSTRSHTIMAACRTASDVRPCGRSAGVSG